MLKISLNNMGIKSMKKEYYTPKIEEFRVGFKFEILEKGKWMKHEVGKAVWNLKGAKIFGQLINTKDTIRVKHLDREDIESFGFVQESLASFVNKDNWYIEWMPSDTLDIYCVSDCRFKGKIRNKSELEVILKQVGVI
jgi:hypothetical protein